MNESLLTYVSATVPWEVPPSTAPQDQEAISIQDTPRATPSAPAKSSDASPLISGSINDVLPEPRIPSDNRPPVSNSMDVPAPHALLVPDSSPHAPNFTNNVTPGLRRLPHTPSLISDISEATPTGPSPMSDPTAFAPTFVGEPPPLPDTYPLQPLIPNSMVDVAFLPYYGPQLPDLDPLVPNYVGYAPVEAAWQEQPFVYDSIPCYPQEFMGDDVPVLVQMDGNWSNALQ